MISLVTGAHGQLGWELARSLQPLGPVHALPRAACDLAQPGALAATVERLRPQVVFNAAAYTAVDRAEQEEALATRINGEALAELGAAARAVGALVLHYSTDYVFDGQSEAAYCSDHPVAPLNAYGRSKLAGEQALAASGCDHLILRTTWVYAARGANFLATMLRLGREREALRVVADQFGAPTWARNLADASAHIARAAQLERAAGKFQSEILHLSSAGRTSWHGFAEAIFAGARARGAELAVRHVEPIPASDYPTPARRPQNSCLDPSRLQARYALTLPHWQRALDCVLDERYGPA